MKISGYSSVVGPASPMHGSMKVSSDPMAYGGDGKGLKAIGSAAGDLLKVALQKEAEQDITDVENATNKANMQMYEYMNGENGVLNTRLGDSASGLSDDVYKQLAKVKAEAMKGLSKRAKEGFNIKFRANEFNYIRAALSHQTNQKKVADANRFDTAIKNNTSNIIMNAYDDDSVNALLLDTHSNAMARASQLGYDKDTAERFTKEVLGGVINNVCSDLSTKKDYNRALALLDKYGDLLPPETNNKMKYQLQDKQMNVDAYTDAANLVDECIDDKGYVDMGKLNNLIEGKYGARSVGGGSDYMAEEGKSWVKKQDVILDGLQDNTKQGLSYIGKLFNSLSGSQLIVTSGTDSTDIHAPGLYGHAGGYKLDVAADWLEDENNRKQFIKGLEDAGIKVLDEYSNPSANSTGGHLDLNFKDFNGASQFNEKLYKKVRALSVSRANDINRAKKAQDLQERREFFSSVNMAPSETEAIQMIIDNPSLTNKQKELAIAEQRKLRNGGYNNPYWRYVSSGKYKRDLALMEQYNDMATDSNVVITPEQQKKFDKAAANLNEYYAAVNPDYNSKNYYNVDLSDNPNVMDIYEGMEKLAEKGATKQEIIDKVKEIAPKYGLDPNYFLDNAEWDKLGPNGVK